MKGGVYRMLTDEQLLFGLFPAVSQDSVRNVSLFQISHVVKRRFLSAVMETYDDIIRCKRIGLA